MARTLSSSVWLAALLLEAGCTNHSPVLLPIQNPEVQVGESLALQIWGHDDDGDSLSFSARELPSGARLNQISNEMALLQWTPIISHAKPDGGGREHRVLLEVSDGNSSGNAEVIITVYAERITSTSPRFISAADYTLNLDQSLGIKFYVQVRDPNSPAINLTMESGPDGAKFSTNQGSPVGAFSWTPTEDQIQQQALWLVKISADDGENLPVVQDIGIRIEGGKSKCEGSRPSVTHQQLPDQNVADAYPVVSTITDAESSIREVFLTWRAVRSDGGAGATQVVALTATGANGYEGVIPNQNLTGDTTANISYFICAFDDDDPEGDQCDQRGCAPAEGQYSFTAYAPNAVACVDDTFDAIYGNDDPSQAVDLGAGFHDGLKTCPGDDDWYSLDIPVNHQATITAWFAAAQGALEVDLYDEAGSAKLASSSSTSDGVQVTLAASTTARTVLMKVAGSPQVRNSYDLTVAFTEDQGSNATEIIPGTQNLTNQGGIDWFKILLDSGEAIDASIQFDTNTSDLDLFLYEEAAILQGNLGTEYAVARSDGSSNSEEIHHSARQDGYHYLSVRPFEKGISNSYVLVVQTDGTCQDDGREPNDSANTASPVSLGDSLDGQQICPGNSDWIRFSALAGQSLAIDLVFAHSQGDLDMVLYGAGILQAAGPGEYDRYQKAFSASSTDNEEIRYQVLEAGDYYLWIYGYFDARNQYRLELRTQ